MANPYRGEVSLKVNGEEQLLRLTLGALADLEDRLKEESLLSLIERFENGAFKARDLLDLLYAGLRGGGWDQDFDALRSAKIEGGPIAAAKAAGAMLKGAFGPE